MISLQKALDPDSFMGKLIQTLNKEIPRHKLHQEFGNVVNFPVDYPKVSITLLPNIHQRQQKNRTTVPWNSSILTRAGLRLEAVTTFDDTESLYTMAVPSSFRHPPPPLTAHQSSPSVHRCLSLLPASPRRPAHHTNGQPGTANAGASCPNPFSCSHFSSELSAAG